CGGAARIAAGPHRAIAPSSKLATRQVLDAARTEARQEVAFQAAAGVVSCTLISGLKPGEVGPSGDFNGEWRLLAPSLFFPPAVAFACCCASQKVSTLRPLLSSKSSACPIRLVQELPFPSATRSTQVP